MSLFFKYYKRFRIQSKTRSVTGPVSFVDMHSKVVEEVLSSMDLSASCSTGDSSEGSAHSGSGESRGDNKKQAYTMLTSAAAAQGRCMVCGGEASGYHYDVLSCEGCKGKCN